MNSPASGVAMRSLIRIDFCFPTFVKVLIKQLSVITFIVVLVHICSDLVS